MEDPPPGSESEGEWCMVNNEGQVYPLPKTMIFLGREECDIELQSQAVDKRHAVVTFDHYLRRFKIKDLSTDNGTYVNDTKIPEQEYVTLEHRDSVRLGNDPLMFHMERMEEPSNRLAADEVFSPDDSCLPSWATTKDDSETKLAECQGCIVEQRIEHTCGESIPESETAHHDLDRSYSHDSIATYNLGCNTWPRKRHKNKKHVAAVFDMDKEIPTEVDSLLDQHQSRVLRGTGAPMNKLPPELATVKKGTPLYGQPEWWGEDSQDDLTNTEKLRSNGVIMDIPKPDRLLQTEPGPSAEPRNTVSNSVCDTNTQQNGVTNPDHVPKTERTMSEKSATPEGSTSMAFTVDFGDSDISSNMSGKKLSEFVPSKIRKSFRERMEKSAEKRQEKTVDKKSEKTTEKKTERTTEKTSAVRSSVRDGKEREREPPHGTSHVSKSLSERAVSEGRDISPTRQRKIDEIWSSGSKSSESISSKRARMLGRAKSSENNDSVLDTSAKGSRPVRRRPPVSTTLTKPKSVIRARKGPEQEPSTAPAVAPAAVQPMADTTTYLIDRMFQDSSKTGSADSNNTEYALYKEAKQYNKEQSQRRSSSHDDSGKQEKPLVIPEVPVVSSQQKSSEAKKDEDNVSEAGTYTIEQEKDSTVEEDARRNIDKVFGVEEVLDSSLKDDLKKSDQKVDKQGELTLNLQLLDNEYRELEELEKLRAQRSAGDSMDVDIGSVDREDEEENPSSSVPDDAPKWVTQWAALTNQKSRNKSGDMELSSPGSSISDDKLDSSRSSGKGQNGISRKRPGTGRKLPTIPPVGVNSEDGDSSIKESPRVSRSDLSVSTSPNTSTGRGVKISSHVSARYQDTDSESISLTKYDDADTSCHGKHGSNGSVVSLDTDILLKDTETVMAAMEARVGSEGKDSVEEEHVQVEQNGRTDYTGLNESVGSDTDTSSVVALVNGDEDYVKPSYYKSPREALCRGKLKLSESLPSKPVVNTGGTKAYAKETSSSARKRSVEDHTSVVSDIYSEINDGQSSASDSTDAGQFNRQGSKGKGTMSMTRPNRAFQLRRARADGDEVLDSSRSVSIASTGFSTPRAGSMSNITKSQSLSRSQKPQRPMSGKFSDRRQDSARSEASLGAQIVQKSRDNAKQALSASTNSVNFTRTDGGRHSLRLSRNLSIPAQSPSTPSGSSSSRSRRSDVTNSSSQQLRHSSSLRVTGVSARERSSSSSQSHSRSNSPKSAERNAWKRRKDYDPRKAVAEAKARSKEVSRKREMNVFGQRVTRSASFTNTRDLNLKLSAYQTESISSADDLSRRSSEASETFDDHGSKRGFVPYSNRSMSSRQVYSSTEEDEVEKYAHTAQGVKRSLPKSNIKPYLSAFTPPPGKSMSLSLFTPSPILKKSSPVPVRVISPSPPSSAMLAKSRRSVDSLELYQCALGGLGTRKLSDPTLHKDSPATIQSYDTIIVSSIYQLSLKLKTSTDRTLEKLRENERIEQNGISSPLDDLENQSTTSEIPAYKSANQELAGVLKNLRKIEQHVKLMNKALFPDEDYSPDTTKEKHEYLQQIERIRNELAGFQPIETPREDTWKAETASVESDCEELGPVEFY